MNITEHDAISTKIKSVDDAMWMFSICGWGCIIGGVILFVMLFAVIGSWNPFSLVILGIPWMIVGILSIWRRRYEYQLARLTCSKEGTGKVRIVLLPKALPQDDGLYDEAIDEVEQFLNPLGKKEEV